MILKTGNRVKFSRGPFAGCFAVVVSPPALPFRIGRKLFNDGRYVYLKLDGGQELRMDRDSSAIRTLSPLEELAEASK